MRKLAIILTFLLIFPAQTFAQDSPQSDIRASSDCKGLPRACAAAAAELEAARNLIAGHQAHIAAADERIAIARKEIESLKGLGQLERERASELEAVIAAERAAKTALREKIALQEKRIKQLEGQARRARKFALITGVAAAVGILIAIGK